MRCREVAEDKLRGTLILRILPGFINPGDGVRYLGVDIVIDIAADESHIKRGLPAVAGNLQHVVGAWVYAAIAQFLRPFDKRSDEFLQLRRCRSRDDMRLAAFDFGRRQLEHVCCLHVGERPEHREQLRQVDELGKARVHPVARTVRSEFQRGDGFAEVGRPGVPVAKTVPPPRSAR